MGNFDQGALGVAVEQQVAFSIDDDAAADFVAPVVVMGDAAQTALNAAQDDGHFFVGFAAALAIDDGGAVGAFAAEVAGGVGIVSADFAISGVTVDHRVHVARRDPPKQVGLAEGFERLGALPVGLGDDTDAKALGLKHPTNHCHAEAGVIDIGVAGNQHDVATVPAELLHFGPTHRQKWCRAKALGPIGAIAAQGFGSARKKGNVNRGVHVMWGECGEEEGGFYGGWQSCAGEPCVRRWAGANC